MTSPRLSITAKKIVTYLVIAVIFFLPSSPSFCISSNAGIAIVRSWMIMEEVIYGVTFNAKIDICVKEPPVNELRKLFASPSALSKYSLIATVFSPGTGINEPKRMTIRTKNVKSNPIRISLTLKASRKVLNILNHLCFSTKSFDLLCSGLTECIRLNSKLFSQLSIS